MADPKIKYDIEAAVSGSGSADVIALANNVEKLAGSLEGDLRVQALASADSLRELGRQDAVLSQFATLRNTVAQTAVEFTAAQKASAALGFEISANAKPTAAQAGQLQKLKDTAKSLEVQLGLESVALQRLSGNLTASGVNTNSFVAEQVRLKNALADVSGQATGFLNDQAKLKNALAWTTMELARQASEEEKLKKSTEAVAAAAAKQAAEQAKLKKSTDAAAASAAKQTGVNKEVAKSYDGVASSLGTLKSQVAGLVGVNIGAGMVKDVLATADAFNNLQARIKISTGEGAAFTSSFKEVSEIALRTGANLEQTGILFTKLVESGKSGGLTLEAAIGQSLRLTEIISQASLIGSSSAESSRAAINQLNQSLASGVLRGDEFNSVMEQAPRISKAMADGLGVTVGQLRSMAEAGALTSDVVIKALKNQADVIQKEFATLPLTVGRSVEKLQTQWALYIGDLDKGNGITAKVAKGLDLLANNLNGVINTVTAGVASYAGYVAANKFLGDGAAVAAAKVEAQALASGKAALATDAHSKAALVAAVEVKAYGNNSAITGAQVAAASKNALVGIVGGAKSAVGAIGGVIGRLTAYGAIAFSVYEVGKLAVSGVKELLKSWSGLTAAEEKLAASEKAYTDAVKDGVIKQEAANLAKQVAIDKTFGLTVASRNLITEFDEVIKKGGSAADAIGKIGKDFDLSTVPGIQGARAVLDKLLSDGKITAKQFKETFDGAFAGIDLTEFNKNAKKVLDDTVAEARAAAKQLEYAIAQGFDKKAIAEFEVAATAALVLADKAAGVLQKNLDAGLRETVKRAGLDFELISTGMGKAAKSAIDDTNVMIKGLTALKAQGVDTGQALTASLGKSINTADSVKALEVVKSQIASVRAALGDKVADGLLDQAKVKALELSDALEKAKPGVQSLREAMKELGLTSREELQATAAKAKDAYDTIIAKGQQEGESYIAWQNRKTEATTIFLQRAIEANGGIAPEWVKTRAAVEGVTIAVDANGKATVENAAKSVKAVADVTASYSVQSEAMDRLMMKYTMSANYTERQIALLEREAAAAEKAAAAENKRLGIDKDKFSVDKDGKRIEQYIETKDSVINTAKQRGLTDDQSKALADKFIDSRGNPTGYGSVDTSRGENWGTALQKAIEEMLRKNRAAEANAKRAEEESRPQNTTTNTANTNTGNTNTSNAGANTSSGGSAKVVNIQIGGSSYPVQTNTQGADNLIKALQIGARNAGY